MELEEQELIARLAKLEAAIATLDQQRKELVAVIIDVRAVRERIAKLQLSMAVPAELVSPVESVSVSAQQTSAPVATQPTPTSNLQLQRPDDIPSVVAPLGKKALTKGGVHRAR